ncbi:hypothetical protein TH25_19190 [Thalassospira profundimaris]|uniref:Uncharacterized protein n=1 Tax=Thalassospira profundimaris TaxID=502049 RepID=A0A367WTR5_9PROT|nr:hypothetical protein [Thalassospira profundimaris]RCK44788.1 hypothetical protein TH25_19190 [Thalassospira profundimaris]
MADFEIEDLGMYECHATENKYRMLKRTRIIHYSNISGTRKDFKGAIDFVTECGQDANLLDEGKKFQLIHTNEVVEKVE